MPRRGASKTSGRAVMAPSIVPPRVKPAPVARRSSPSGARLHVMSRLDDVDLTLRLSKKEAKTQLAAAQERLVHLRLLLGGQIGPKELGPPLCVLFEGWDASGKGGAIQRLVSELDPRHVRVAQFAAPSYDEKRHHFLWRFWPELPGLGRHGRAGPQLVRPGAGRAGRGFRPRGGLAAGLLGDRRPRDDARRRGHDPGQVLDARVAGGAAAPVREAPGRPLQDVEAHRRGLAQPREAGAYEVAVEDMLERTDHPAGPWHVVAGDDKRWARVDVVRTVCQAMEQGAGRPRHRPRSAAERASSPVPGRRAGGSRRASRCRPPPRR